MRRPLNQAMRAKGYKDPAKKIEKLSDLTPDSDNANKGTVRGLGVIEESLARCGAGRSVLADRNGKLIAGNKTVEGAINRANGDDDVIVVQTDGKKIVVVQRVDLDLETDEQARLLAFADNRASQVSLDWNPQAFVKAEEDGLDVSWMFRPEEIPALPLDDDLSGLMPEGEQMKANGHSFTLTLIFNTEKEMKLARKDLQGQGYAIKGYEGDS